MGAALRKLVLGGIMKDKAEEFFERCRKMPDCGIDTTTPTEIWEEYDSRKQGIYKDPNLSQAEMDRKIRELINELGI